MFLVVSCVSLPSCGLDASPNTPSVPRQTHQSRSFIAATKWGKQCLQRSFSLVIHNFSWGLNKTQTWVTEEGISGRWGRNFICGHFLKNCFHISCGVPQVWIPRLLLLQISRPWSGIKFDDNQASVFIFCRLQIMTAASRLHRNNWKMNSRQRKRKCYSERTSSSPQPLQSRLNLSKRLLYPPVFHFWERCVATINVRQTALPCCAGDVSKVYLTDITREVPVG